MRRLPVAVENLNAFILGIVEGLTEFLPISSTGHMILTSSILGINLDEHFWKNFLIIIQLGSILAVLFIFWRNLTQSLEIWLKLAIAFIPTGLAGLFIYPFIKQLFNGYIVAFMLIVGGLVFILIERAHKGKSYAINSLGSVSFKQAFFIGTFQALAIVPGTSRSGASIIGGLMLGLNRKCAAEFSFLLALPTMFVATGYDIYKNPQILSSQDSFFPILIGFITAFVVAVFVIKLFLNFIAKFSFVPFGIYRIFLGLVFLSLFYSGILPASKPF